MTGVVGITLAFAVIAGVYWLGCSYGRREK